MRRPWRIGAPSARRWVADGRLRWWVGPRRPVWPATPALSVVLVALLCLTPAVYDRYLLPALRPYLPHTAAPPPGVEAAEHPLGAPPAVLDTGGYRFMDSPDPGQAMVAFDPCRPVHYVVRPDGAPVGGQQLIEEAVAEVSAATGLRFVDDGATSEAPDRRRQPYQPGRYGKRWAPVLITWSDAGEHPGLAGDVAGLGGGTARRAQDGPLVYVTGQVTLDVPSPAVLRHRPQSVRAVIMHELAHVAGLDHVDDPRQLMHGDNVGVVGLADGDRAGLAALGAGACAPQL